MAVDIVDQLIDLADRVKREDGKSTIIGAAHEIQNLREQNEHLKLNVEQLLHEARSIDGNS